MQEHQEGHLKHSMVIWSLGALNLGHGNLTEASGTQRDSGTKPEGFIELSQCLYDQALKWKERQRIGGMSGMSEPADTSVSCSTLD